MALQEEVELTGNWLFKRRSFLPLILFVCATVVIFTSHPDGLPHFHVYFNALCLLLSMTGLGIRCFTVGFTPKHTSGRNVKQQIADVVNTKGIYSIVRHPLYLGNYLMWLGPIIYVGNMWFIIVCSLLFWLYYERIMFAEEAFLRQKFNSKYLKWADHTPAFIPAFKQWKAADMHFSLRNVMKREYSGLLNTALSFVYIDMIKNYALSGKIYVNSIWTILFIVCLVIFSILRTLKKRTSLLNVAGR